jgi:CheY-like chemotaxis protein
VRQAIDLAVARPAATLSGSTGDERPARILVVDDNADLAATLTAILRAWGHTTAVAHNGRDALERLEGFDADLALLDLSMPIMDGLELAQHIRRNPRLRQLRLVALTGHDKASDYRQSSNAEFDAYVSKPIDPEKLARLLAEQLGAARPSPSGMPEPG